MKMRIRKRSLFIALISTSILGCLLAGLFGYCSWLQLRMNSVVCDQVLNDNIQTARQLHLLIEEMNIGDVREDQSSWERLQNVVEDIELPNEGFVCVVDHNTALLLCHPAMRHKPELREVPVGECSIEVNDETTNIVSAIADNQFIPTGGIAFIKGESQVVAVAHLESINANLLVHQRVSGISKAISRIMTPVMTIGVLVAILVVLAVTALAYSITKRFDNRVLALNEQLEDLVDKRTRSLMSTRNAVIFGLAKLAESRDTDTGQHLERIRSYVTLLAKAIATRNPELNLDEQYVEQIALASSLHDIGKVGIPDKVLLKPGKFLPEERQIMERHSNLGGTCLYAIQQELGDDDFLSMATEIAFFHHERWDGTGYPARLSGAKIPLSARIVALADVYDALTSKRPYKDAMSHEKARKIIMEGCGNHFDPLVIQAFLDSEGGFIDIARANDEVMLSHIEKQLAELNEMMEPEKPCNQESALAMC